MSSSSTAANGSRSPSPTTPDSSDPNDQVAVNSTSLGLPSWLLSNTDSQQTWDLNSPFTFSGKLDNDSMLGLEEVLEQHALADSPSPSYNAAFSPSSPLHRPATTTVQPVPGANPLADSIVHTSKPLIKPVPPPTPLARKVDPSTLSQHVVHPPKESCFNLPIMFPSIPEGGTKSRVETQVRVTVDLADSSSSSDPYKYARVGSWKWLKLPPGTATKRRTRKQGKIDPDPRDTLILSVTVTCASPPHNRVLSCSSCQAREAKRVAKKIAARVRPTRSDSESGDNSTIQKPKHHEDTTSIIQFNCAEVLDFSTGSVVLPLRITCYCRHHREKVGFNIHFTMMDNTGRIIGTGSSRPIMITDDHKTATVANARHNNVTNNFAHIDASWSTIASLLPSTNPGAPSRRKKEPQLFSAGKKRPKPYDSSQKPIRPSREGSVSSVPSPAQSHSALPLTRSPTPPNVLHPFVVPDPALPLPALQSQSQVSSDTTSGDALNTPADPGSDVHMAAMQTEISSEQSFSLHVPPAPAMIASHPHSLPFMFFNAHQTSQALLPPMPTIHRLIPNMGPTHGGIEVTILGANFLPSMQLNCVFGDTMASSTQRWSDNALVCVLPPRSAPGVVAVWFDGYPKLDDHNGTPPSLFTYSDESDRALMELALQVVGLKMTGKIEDAKNVAMRIVGSTGADSSSSQHSTTGTLQMANRSLPFNDLRSITALPGGDSEELQNKVLSLLGLLEISLEHPASDVFSISRALSLQTSGGQTLLHLAAFMGFPALVIFLVEHGIDLDARDRNGYTALHFAAISSSVDCARILLTSGADLEIVNATGKTAKELATKDFFRNVGILSEVYDDSESCWGDGEDEEEEVPRRSHRATRRGARRIPLSRRTSKHNLSTNISRAPTPPPIPPEKTAPPITKSDEAKQSAWFVEMIQRTFTQIAARQGILPNIPLPLPQLPTTAWNALPQLPMVFPVFIPMMPGWPSFLGGEQQYQRQEGESGKVVDSRDDQKTVRALWEKWLTLAIATTARQQQQQEQENDAPPIYTPRAAEERVQHQGPQVHLQTTNTEVQASPDEDEAQTSRALAEMRRVGYDMMPVPDQEVNAFAYRPPTTQANKLQKKHDRMLLVFWLPILLLSLLWASYHAVRVVFQVLRNAAPSTMPLRA
ncbi:hypothetical protein AX16_005219 [Volvariella volvacea WC 439]|nr:hypothetical protein AX16_005219 [Volvariella volvacea WC 439]